MLEAIVWGLVQGLTEFLPVSSSGHLRLIPELFGLDPPDLTASAVLHLGTLLAVAAYYRSDIAWIIRGLGRNTAARRLALMLAAAAVPAAAAGAFLSEAVGRFQESAAAVGAALLATGAVLLASRFFARGIRRAEDAGLGDAAAIGLAQALALLPGISRSGMVITAGMMRGLSEQQAARFGFLTAVPIIAGAGAREAWSATETGAFGPELILGTAVAALSGYWAISLLLKALTRLGLWPFALYCLAAGTAALVWT